MGSARPVACCTKRWKLLCCSLARPLAGRGAAEVSAWASAAARSAAIACAADTVAESRVAPLSKPLVAGAAVVIGAAVAVAPVVTVGAICPYAAKLTAHRSDPSSTPRCCMFLILYPDLLCYRSLRRTSSALAGRLGRVSQFLRG